MQNAEYRMQNERHSILHSIFCILHSAFLRLSRTIHRKLKIMDPAKLKELLDQMPRPIKGTPPPPGGKKPGTPDGILADVDAKAVNAALAEMEAGGREVVLQLADLLIDSEPAKDSRIRHAIHAMMTRACGADDDKRKAYGNALVEAIVRERSTEPTAFLIRQIQFCAGEDAIPALARFLTNDDLAAPALAAMESIGPASAAAIRAALPAAKGRTRIGVVLALGSLRDAAAAASIRPLISDANAEMRLAAAWSAARLADAEAVDVLIKTPAGEGFDRIKLNSCCILLAENLAKAGKTAEAKKLYAHLRETRLEEKEAHIRDAAKRGMSGL
jgi:hypothetical protein